MARKTPAQKATTKPLPAFHTEKEEAAWYAEHKDDLDEYLGEPQPTSQPLHQLLNLPPMQEAVAAAKKPPSEPIKLRMVSDDLALAKQQAAKKGLGYQTYLKMLIREGLSRNA